MLEWQKKQRNILRVLNKTMKPSPSNIALETFASHLTQTMHRIHLKFYKSTQTTTWINSNTCKHKSLEWNLKKMIECNFPHHFQSIWRLNFATIIQLKEWQRRTTCLNMNATVDFAIVVSFIVNALCRHFANMPNIVHPWRLLHMDG
jgi:hypothetical protein